MCPTSSGQMVWSLIWFIQAWAPGNHLEYADSGVIMEGQGSSVTFNNQLFNLTIDATLNNGEITSARVIIIDVNNGKVLANKSFSLPYPIPDTQVFLETEVPAIGPNGNLEIVPPPIMVSNNYLFVNGAYESYGITNPLPYAFAVQYNMGYGNSLVGIPTYTSVSQGFEYLW